MGKVTPIVKSLSKPDGCTGCKHTTCKYYFPFATEWSTNILRKDKNSFPCNSWKKILWDEDGK